ncbi:MAG: universal stress protein [Bacillota bacterium]
MTYRIVAVHVNESQHLIDRINVAAQVARDAGAHLVGVACSGPADNYYMADLLGAGSAGLNIYRDFMKEQCATNLAAFEAAADKAGVPFFEKRVIEDEAGIALCLQARYSDLLVVGQPDPDEMPPAQRADMVEYVLMHSGRPLLLVPYAWKAGAIGKRVMVAWDGSLEAARAVSGAIPLLRNARLVQVTVFNPEVGPDAHGEEPGADIALYLERHGIEVEVSRQHVGHQIDVGNAMLSHAADIGADLIVMGGYGHARFREVLMGGVTQTILRSMTVPVLMSH